MCSFCVKISENLDQELLIRTEKTKVRRNADCFYMAQDEKMERGVVKEWLQLEKLLKAYDTLNTKNVQYLDTSVMNKYGFGRGGNLAEGRSRGLFVT